MERLEDVFIFEHTEFYFFKRHPENYLLDTWIYSLESMKEVGTKDKRFKSH